MKRRLIVLLKLLLVAVVFGVIFASIDWHDSYLIRSANGETSPPVAGKIVGAWDADVVRFIPEGKTSDIALPLTPAADGATVILTPGFLTYLRNVDLILFGLGALLYFTAVIIIAIRWWWFLKVNGLGVSCLEAIRFTWIGLFFNNLIPGATGGDLVRAALIAKRCPGQGTRAFVSVFVDRIVGFISLVLFGALTSLWILDRFPAITYTVWGLGILGIAVFALMLSPGLRRTLKLSRLINKLPTRVGRLVREANEAVMYYRGHLRGIAAWIALGPVPYSLLAVSVVLIDRALGVGLAVTDYFVIVPLITIASAVPITPNGWGVGEALYGTLVGKLGAVYLPDVPNAEQIMRTRGVALSVLHRIQLVLWSLLGGLFLLWSKRSTDQSPSSP